MEWKEYWETLPEDFKEFAKDNGRMKRCMNGTEEIPHRYVDIFNGKAHPDFNWDCYFRMQEFFKNYKDPFQKAREADPLYRAFANSPWNRDWNTPRR